MSKMKKMLSVVMAVIMLLSAAPLNSVFDESVLQSFSVTAEAASKKKIHVKKKNITVTTGTTYTQKLLDKKDKTISASKVKWKSSNKKIAKIDKNGKITAVKKGTAKMTATYKGKKYSFTVTVKNASFKYKERTLLVGKSFTQKLLKVNGKAIAASDIKWKSSNKKVAKVNDNGKVTAVKKGTATITATFKGKSYKFTVTVRKTPKLTLDESDITLYVGGSNKTLKATAVPSGVEVKWKSSDKKVAKVSSKGKITPVAKGKATITASFKYKDKTYKDTCKVVVDLKTKTSIPATIQKKDWGLRYLEYCPTFSFNQDMTCVVRFNMLEWIETVTATYSVSICDNGRRLIKVDFDDTNFFITGNDITPFLYLVETDNKCWTYWGELLGESVPGTEFEPSSTLELSVAAQEMPKKTKWKGTYTMLGGDMFDTLIVEKESADEIKFNVEWPRIDSIREASGKTYGNLVFFEYTVDGIYDETWGVMEFNNKDKVDLTLFETNLHINKGTYTYEFVSEQKRMEQFDLLYLSYLLFNNESKGWVLGRDVPKGSPSNVYMRFFSNGSMVYLYGTDLGGHISYKEYNCKYKIENEVLYIGSDAYHIYMYSAGTTTMELKAKNVRGKDLSGYYMCEENEMYQYMLGDR